MTFLWLAAATLASEDLACIAAGLLVARGQLDWWTATGACAVGIFAGDAGLYWIGRLFRVSAQRWSRAQAWFSRFGSSAVFVSRFLPGFRVPAYLAAGALGMRFAPFVAWLAAAVLLWTTAIVTVTAALGRAPHLLWLTAPAAAWWLLRRTKWSRWEFWPVWLAYLPVIPYVLWLAVRYRSVTLFRQANPGMKNGGLVGESKSDSLAHLRAGAPEHVPEFVVAQGLAPRIRKFPVVLKPDVGERGRGVVIARSQAEVDAYDFSKPVIVQDYVAGDEFGLYWRQGQLTSITRKVFPFVTGDGVRTVAELIDADERARLIRAAYRQSCSRFDAVPAAGERVALVEIGSHCRGTIFLDGRQLWTPALAAAVDRVARTHPGFHIGRFDVRAVSVEALQRGEFQVLELNGAGGEPAHIYDPGVPLREAYHTLFAHWRAVFEIGATQAARTGVSAGGRITTAA